MAQQVFGTTGMLATMDEQITKIEQMVDQGRIQYMITVAIEKPVDEQRKLSPVHLLPLETPFEEVRDYLQVALAMIDDHIGKQEKQS